MRKKGKTERLFGLAAALASVVALAACVDEPNADWGDAPPSGAPRFVAAQSAAPRPTYLTVIVRPHDTLSSIAARYDVSVSQVAELNQLSDVSHIARGESLRIPAASRATRAAVLGEATDAAAPIYAPPPKPIEIRKLPPVAPETTVAVVTPPPQPRPEHEPVTHEAIAEVRAPFESSAQATADAPAFTWPLAGPVILPFGNVGGGERNDGINIAASEGTPIHAAASGTVTYVGNELRGYGNLVLIQHNDGYVTAYAHAQSVSVKRGDRVDKGQVIALAGSTGEVDRPQLHFEIRKGVQPINPKLLLASK